MQKREAQRDPLARFTCRVWAQESLYRAMSDDPPPEVYWHAANSGGKTTGGVALDLAFLRGESALGGVPIPVVAPPVSGVLIVPSYKVAAGSSLAALRALLGEWPHHEGVVQGSQDAVGLLYVRHRQSHGDDYRRWSRLYIFPHDGELPEGLRLDFAHGDEPPPQRVWDAVRNRGKAGRPFFRYITATPVERRFWQWIRDDFPREERRVEGGKVRLRSTLYDNQALTPADIRRSEEANARSPYRLARLYGEHVDIAGTCPFDADTLLAMRDDCRDGERFAAVPRLRDGAERWSLVRHPRGQVEAWGDAAPVDRVLVLCDPSSGVADPDKLPGQQQRNPAALMAVSIVQRKMLARFNGYVTPPELGLMARAVCNGYRDWIFVPEMNGGWGEECLRSFMAAEAAEGSQGFVYQDVDPTSTTGNARTRVGWWQTAARRGALVAALQRALLERSLGIPSLAALENLGAVRLDEKDRYDQPGGGAHAEDMILLGMACSIMENPQLLPAALPQADESALEAFKRESGIRIAPSYDGYAPDDGKWR